MRTASEEVINVDGISKRYRLGSTIRHDTLRDAVSAGFSRIIGRGAGNGDARPRAQEDFWALKDVSFTVNEGEVVGIIGRNGAGKSTLLKILSRITDPTEGVARLRGRVTSLLEVGTGFHPELTGRENVFLNGAILGMGKAEIKRKFDEIVAFAEIEKFLDTPVKRYSSGMYVRLAFAVAAHLEPEILIVDEVLAVGDTAFQKKCLGKMQDVSCGGRTVLFVSHNMAAVQKLCNRCVLLEGGRLALVDGTRKVIESYLSSIYEGTREGSLEGLTRIGSHGRDIRIKSVTVMNSGGQAGSSIMFGEPFGVEVEVVSYKELKDLSVVIGIDASNAYRISTVASEFAGRLFEVSSGAGFRARAFFDELWLNPGRYTVTVSIRVGKEGLDLVVNAGWFDVVEAAYSEDAAVTGLWGAVQTTARWEHEDVVNGEEAGRA